MGGHAEISVITNRNLCKLWKEQQKRNRGNRGKDTKKIKGKKAVELFS